MKQFVLLVLLMCPAVVYSAETEVSKTQAEEPKLLDHFVAMQQTEMGLSKLSNEEQARLQPQIRQAELRACQRLRQDRQEGMREEDYRRQGGDQLVATVLQFERYCETLR